MTSGYVWEIEDIWSPSIYIQHNDFIARVISQYWINNALSHLIEKDNLKFRWHAEMNILLQLSCSLKYITAHMQMLS